MRRSEPAGKERAEEQQPVSPGLGVASLHALLARRREALAREHDVECIVTGVASRRLGWRAMSAGQGPLAPGGAECAGVREWLVASAPDVVCEAVPLDPHAGQPALDYLRAAIEHGAHAVSANKGPVSGSCRETRRPGSS